MYRDSHYKDKWDCLVFIMGIPVSKAHFYWDGSQKFSPWGQDIVCLLWNSKFDVCSMFVIALLLVISCYIEPCYKGTRLSLSLSYNNIKSLVPRRLGFNFKNAIFKLDLLICIFIFIYLILMSQIVFYFCIVLRYSPFTFTCSIGTFYYSDLLIDALRRMSQDLTDKISQHWFM